MNGLRLDMSIGREKYDAMEETYRNEGLSVGADHMVILSIFACLSKSKQGLINK